MKRYRVMANEFDYRANVLKVKIEESWTPQIKQMWNNIQGNVSEDIIAEYGLNNSKIKFENLNEIGAKPSSIIAYHNSFFSQIRDSYIFGAYYPALTGACSLGERILNQLIINMRDYYKHTPEYRLVYRKASFDNWDIVINTLQEWNVLEPLVIEAFKELKDIRNHSVHFNPSTELLMKPQALEAIKLITIIIDMQFSSHFNGQSWCIPDVPGGIAFIKKEAEEIPFVKEVLIPNSELVGYKHKLVSKDNVLVPEDDYKYEDREITDDEFKDLYIQNNN